MEQPYPKITKPVLARIEVFDRLPDDALMKVSEVAALAGRSIPSVWRDCQAGHLAAPVKIGAKATRWRAGDVRSYLAGRP